WFLILSIGILSGLYAAFNLFTKGHILFNTNDVIIWSLPLGVYIFLALTSSGLTLLSAIPLVFGVGKYQPFAKRLVFLAVATLCGGFVSIGLELGTVEHMIYIMLSPNLSSPIWWMGAIYSVELVLLIAKFWRLHAGDWHSGFSKFLGSASFFCALAAPLMIGSVFGLTESRITYFGPVMSIYCLLMAFLSGLSFFILYSVAVEKIGNSVSNGNENLYSEFISIFRYAASAVVVFTIVKIAIESATVVPEFLVSTKFKYAFGSVGRIPNEIVFGLFLPFILVMIPILMKSQAGRAFTAALMWIGALAMHMQILIAGQSHPIGPKAEQFPEFISYSPSSWEWLVFLFAVSIMLLLYTLGERYLKLTEVKFN
ncbi:MAG: NrfD/PsrC family molybdoenzyme membrane anchor subunit, partial [Thermodesulfobacteriota bacterium]